MTEDEDHLRRKAVSGSKSRPNDWDGGDHIRSHKAALEEANVTVIFEHLRRQVIVRKMKVGEERSVELTLKGEIVDRQHGWKMAALPGEIRRHQGGRPIVGVYQIGGPFLIDGAAR